MKVSSMKEQQTKLKIMLICPAFLLTISPKHSRKISIIHHDLCLKRKMAYTLGESNSEICPSKQVARTQHIPFLRHPNIFGWCFQAFFMFTPILGEMIQFDERIVQMGWLQPPTRYRPYKTPLSSLQGAVFHGSQNPTKKTLGVLVVVKSPKN